MEFEKLPVGFAMALAQNRAAMETFAAMPEEQKKTVIHRAHHVRNKNEMQQVVTGLAGQG